MAEKKSRLMPLSSNFNKYAIEERITAIMKIKKSSAVLWFSALILIGSVTTVFATSDADTSPNKQSADIETRFMTDKQADTEQPHVEWWTYDTYKAWLEQEKEFLYELTDSGAIGYNPSDGWYEWSQREADKLIAGYENTLAEIKNGKKLSQNVKGEDDIIFSVTESSDTDTP